MTKQHFIALADKIRFYNHELPESQKAGHSSKDSHIMALGDFCQQVNPAFKKDRWIDYINGKCGKNGGPVKA